MRNLLRQWFCGHDYEIIKEYQISNTIFGNIYQVKHIVKCTRCQKLETIVI